ncbi:MAG TPA: DUF1932 domain-containing protein [Xanthobacteraceae bacterium]|nr:DUF1932 domain-containing protein [Xanthobacteraceae bacterium]
MDGEIGDASALKLCYATLTKGFTALGAASAAAASRAGVADALQRELAASQPAMLAYLTRAVPTMFSKAYRWVGEMEEIAQFYERNGERAAFEGIAALYERLAQDQAGPQAEIDVLAKFFAQATAEKL